MISFQNQTTQLAVIILFAASMIISAFFWERYFKLRKLPILISTLIGVYFSTFNSIAEELSKRIEIIVVFFLIGVVLYACVWIQCREKNDNFFR